jgi:hypothetical protein
LSVQCCRIRTGYLPKGDSAMQLALDIIGDESDAQPGNLGVLIV